jgi:hypothetical protein
MDVPAERFFLEMNAHVLNHDWVFCTIFLGLPLFAIVILVTLWLIKWQQFCNIED